MSKKYKAVFYDWDGCMVQTIDLWLAAYKQVLADEAIYPEDSAIIELFGNWSAPQILGHSNLKKATDQVLEYVHDHITDVEFYKEALNTIKRIKEKDLMVAIVTSSRCQTIQMTDAYKAVKQYVNILLCSDDVNEHKPNPEVINLGLQKLGLKPHEVLMVGDSDKDIGAANNARVDSVLFAPKKNAQFHPHSKLIEELSPTHVISTHAEILELV